MTDLPNKLIGILGGLGPAAGIALHQRIIANTKAHKDQEHLPVIHCSFSNEISDRSAYILGKSNINPAYEAFNIMKVLAHASDYPDNELFVGIPCATFHSPIIFDPFMSMCSHTYPSIHVLNMIQLTAQYISNTYPFIHRVGVLCTSGSRASNVYGYWLQKYNLNLLYVDENQQSTVHDSPVSPRAQQSLHTLVLQLIEKGAECIILGCTELPLALPLDVIRNIPIIDPMKHLARGLINQVNPNTLLEYPSPLSSNLHKGLGYDL
ncbi:hypothetical protein WA158_007459 [Blastocystis sp. Blastoise]